MRAQVPGAAALFSETPARAVVAAGDAAAVLSHAARAGVAAEVIGEVGGRDLDLGVVRVGLDAVGAAWRATLPSLLR